MSHKNLAPLELAKSALALLQEGSDSEDEILALSLVTSAVALHLLKQPKYGTKIRRIAVQDELDDDFNSYSKSPSPDRSMTVRRLPNIRPEMRRQIVMNSPPAPIEEKIEDSGDADDEDFKIELHSTPMNGEQFNDTETNGDVKDGIQDSDKKRRKQWSQFEDERRRVLLGLKPTDSLDLFCAEPKITDYMSLFLDFLKLDINTFNLLLSLIKKDIDHQTTCMRMTVASEQRLAIILRYLAAGETYITMERNIKVSRSFLCVNLPQLSKALWTNLQEKYLKLPSCEAEWANKAEEFDNQWHFPLCLGVLTRRHFKFKSPRTANLLALVDANSKFLHVAIEKEEESVYLAQDTAPPPQSIGNNRVLPYVFISENGFDLDDHILTPFVYTDTIARRDFNNRLKAAAQVADHAFRLLVKRFKILSSQLSISQPNLEDVIKACCILHNFLIEHNSDLYAAQPDEEYTEAGPEVIALGGVTHYNENAEAMREEFADYFANEGNVPTFDVRMLDDDIGASSSNVVVDVMSL
ncbi:uncharacterized protein LOC129918667 [Episyrphus balteatus]|uniref:uncharacterized protein LOC129918667 n=1 Tax=Episyrphus balteatus TaxID=286459 RepID=UPI0024860DED|nr:uncharacterized protein LOC129918667 [Episyrphus balteatus]